MQDEEYLNEVDLSIIRRRFQAQKRRLAAGADNSRLKKWKRAAETEEEEEEKEKEEEEDGDVLVEEIEPLSRMKRQNIETMLFNTNMTSVMDDNPLMYLGYVLIGLLGYAAIQEPPPEVEDPPEDPPPDPQPPP